MCQELRILIKFLKRISRQVEPTKLIIKSENFKK